MGPIVFAIFGLPSHPLMVHAAVVMVPLSAVLFAGLSWRADLRRSFLALVLVLAIAGAGGAILAASSGESLQHSVRQVAQQDGDPRPSFGEHPEQGNTAEFLAIVFAASVAVVFAAEGLTWLHDRGNESGLAKLGERIPSWGPMALYVLALIPAGLATMSMIAAGHSGAQLVWDRFA